MNRKKTKKTQKLKYVITIPSVDIRNYIAINDLILLGSSDNRYQELKEKKNLEKEKKFKEAFKEYKFFDKKLCTT